jgi:hypothetical protein
MRAVVKIAVVFLLLLLLSGCDESGYDARMAVGGAQSTLSAATLRAQGTYEALANMAATGTLRAASTQQASEVERGMIVAQIEGTRQAVGAIQTLGAETAQAENWRATGTVAAVTTATAGARQGMEWQATATAMALDTQRDAQQYQFRQFFLVFLAMSMVALVGIGLHAALRFVEWLIVWQDRKNMYYETTRGIVIFAPGPDGDLIPVAPGQVVEARRPALMAGKRDDKVYKLTASGSVLMSPMAGSGKNTVHQDAIKLVEAGITAYGAESVVVPGYRELEGWSSSVWQRVVAAMAAAGLVEARPGVGTYITERGGLTLDGLRYMLVSNRAHLRPAPLVDDHG